MFLCRRRRLGSEDGAEGAEPPSDTPPSPTLLSPPSPSSHPSPPSSSSSSPTPPSLLSPPTSFPFLPPSPIHLSPYDLARRLTLSKSLLSLSGYKGYRTVRATHGLSSPSSLYFELTYREAATGCGVRVGVCTVAADVDGCVGMDRYGYGVSSRGWRGHDGVWEEWEGGVWRSGDVIGVHLQLGRGTSATPAPPVPLATLQPPLLPPPLSTLLTAQRAVIFHLGSSLTFYRNGQLMGTAFTDLLRASAYYPALSLYYGAEVDVRFGPGFLMMPAEVGGVWWPPRGGEEGREGRVQLARRGVLHVGEGWEGGGLVMNPRHVQLEREKEREREEEERERERRAKERERESRERLEKGREKEQKTRESQAQRRAATVVAVGS